RHCEGCNVTERCPTTMEVSSVRSSKKKILPAHLLGALLAAALLSGCSTSPEPQTSPTPDVTTTATPQPDPAEPTSPVASSPGVVEQDKPVPAAPTRPAVDDFSQVIEGVLYQGTEKAPVRIGADTPGQPPVA